MVKSSSETKDPLRIISHAKGFHFYTVVGDYCGVSVHSLEEFADALQYVCSEAIVFHFARAELRLRNLRSKRLSARLSMQNSKGVLFSPQVKLAIDSLNPLKKHY